MNGWPITTVSDNGACRFDLLAGSVLSLDAGIEWVALEQAGRPPRWGWRDTSTGTVVTGVASPDMVAADPLLLVLAEGGEQRGDETIVPHGLLFVLVAYTDVTQIVARWGSDSYVSLAAGTAVNAHVLGKKLVRLLDRSANGALVD